MITLGAYVLIAGAILMLLANHQTRVVEQQQNTNADAVAAEVANQDAATTDPSTTPSTTQAGQTKGQNGSPVRIQVLEADINIAVAPGVYNTSSQTWTLSTTKAHYALVTPKPNTDGGNTFIYGHNRKSVFARLTGIKVGSTAVITTDKNQRFTYRLRAINTTTPTDDSLFHYSGPPILTLQTCTGANFQNRTLYVFDLIGVTNA